MEPETIFCFELDENSLVRRESGKEERLMPKTKLIFHGAGFMGQCAHIRNYALLSDQCELLAVSDAIPGKAKKVAAHYNIPFWYESGEEMLRKHAAEADAVVAIGPFGLYGSILPRIIATGKPFLIEKPLSNSIAMGKKLVDSIREAGSSCMVAYHKRSDPATIWAKREIDRLKESGELGALKYVKSIMPPGDWVAMGSRGYLDADGAPPLVVEYRSDPPEPGYSQADMERFTWFVNFYIHQVNLLRHILGEDYAFDYVDPAGILVVGHSVSGVTCSLEMDSCQTTLDWQESITACFEHGWVRVELPAPLAINRPGRVTVFRDPGNGAVPTWESPQLEWTHAMLQQAANFLKFVRKEAPAPCDADEALLDLRAAGKYLELYNQAKK